ncbi:MAG: hypothetical protein HYZ36_05725 [Pedosphaera parvula]|nr:hypothetical protein [Pedosphaera parvula]
MSIHSQHLNVVGPGRTTAAGSRARQEQAGCHGRAQRRPQIICKLVAKQPVIGSDGQFRLPKPSQRHVAKAAANGIPHQERAHEDGGAHGGAQHHTQMGTRMVPQAP